MALRSAVASTPLTLAAILASGLLLPGEATGLGVAAAADPDAPPRLVLQITVDQLRGDLPARYLERMGDDGFRYLLEQGIVFRDAHHAHANTETIVGHVTLSTGAHPAAHGMVGNVWFDHGAQRLVYNIEDDRYPLLDENADVNQETEIDPTQRAARSSGRSPANILVSTLSDELSLHTAGAAKIFGVSVKDRGAVAMAGHAGKAYWFSKEAGAFVTSRYYADAYPDWVSAWNAASPTERFGGKAWELLHPIESYQHGDRDDQAWETDFPGYGRVFPHPYGAADDKYFTTRLTLGPAGDALTLDFATALIEHEALGTDAVTDYLSVSFSSTDYVGHLFGPSSLEMEDNLLHLDRTLAALLRFVDERIGLEHTLVILSADHGGPEAPGRLRELGIEAEYVEPDEWDTVAGMAALERSLGVGAPLILSYAHPYLYLDHDVISAHGLALDEVQVAVAEELVKLRGVALAVPSTAIARGALPDTIVHRAVLHNHHPRLSGDIFVVFEPHWFIRDFDGISVASTHGSPWRYDSHVPVVFAGCGLAPRQIFRRVETVDVAPTIAAWVGTGLPSATAGDVLPEVLQQRR